MWILVITQGRNLAFNSLINVADDAPPLSFELGWTNVIEVEYEPGQGGH